MHLHNKVTYGTDKGEVILRPFYSLFCMQLFHLPGMVIDLRVRKLRLWALGAPAHCQPFVPPIWICQHPRRRRQRGIFSVKNAVSFCRTLSRSLSLSLSFSLFLSLSLSLSLEPREDCLSRETAAFRGGPMGGGY